MRVVFPPSSVLLAAACAIGSLSVASAWTTSTSTAVRCTTKVCSGKAVMRPLRSTPDNGDEAAATSDNDEAAPPQSLVLGDGLGDEMAKLRSKYPTSEVDYLAAARARNAAKQASTSHGDEKSWTQLADEKRKAGELQDDAWESSRLEAGNADSQILIPMSDPDEKSDDSENPEEPKLLLW